MERHDYNEKKYFAFISYSSKDKDEAKRLHHKLEYFKVTSAQAAQKGWKRKPLNPTFFAPYEIQPNGLTEELQTRLRNSKYLIVVCSPNSANSKWVQWEIEYFISLGRKDNIYLFIVEGSPNSENPTEDCYGIAIKENGLSGKLGVNIHEKEFKFGYLNRERAYIQLITKLLGIEFDTVWQRHKRKMILRYISAIFLSIVVMVSILGATYLSSSFDGCICFNQASTPVLYEGNGTLRIIIDNDTITQPVNDTKQTYIVKNIPGRYRYKKARCQFNMFGYNEIDTIIQLSNEVATILIQRIPDIYGHIEGQVVYKNINLTPISGAKIILNQICVLTDTNGNFSIDIPIDYQNSNYYNAMVKYEGVNQRIKLYPMRRNPNINNLIVIG